MVDEQKDISFTRYARCENNRIEEESVWTRER